MSDQYLYLDQNNKLIWNFRDIGHTMRQISEGKGSQKRILIILLENPKMTQKELTARLGVQPGSVSEVLSKLEASGLLQRCPSAEDHRTTQLTLSEKGQAAAKEASLRRKERHEQMFSSLSSEEKEQLIVLLERINTDWDQKYRTQDGE